MTHRDTQQASTPPVSDLLTAFAPHAHDDATVLILGSMPGTASLQHQQYYAHPRNSLWPIMYSVFRSENQKPSGNYDQRLRLLTENRIALWDVLKHCQRQGSLDANIQRNSTICNDFVPFLNQYRAIRKILFNGKTSERLFTRHIKPTLAGIDIKTIQTIQTIGLPSTSPAMATMTLAEKTVVWRQALIE